jgi:hypothetical protein
VLWEARSLSGELPFEIEEKSDRRWRRGDVGNLNAAAAHVYNVEVPVGLFTPWTEYSGRNNPAAGLVRASAMLGGTADGDTLRDISHEMSAKTG